MKKGDTCTWSLGGGGDGGGKGDDGSPGGTTTITCGGTSDYADGGVRGKGKARGGNNCGSDGESATFRGVTYSGGDGTCKDRDGRDGGPGAGGGGAGSTLVNRNAGGAGGPGRVWISYEILKKK